MSSREKILDALGRAVVPARELPADILHAGDATTHAQRIEGFVAAAAVTGAEIVHARASDVTAVCDALYPDAIRRVSVLGTIDPALSDASRHSFADTDVFCCRASCGIIENGAVWLPLSHVRYRAALFLATNVIVVLDSRALVRTFHDAYEHVDISTEAFGVFVAGPSKTADIEQSLVVGAHGPKSLTIVMTDA